MLHMPVLETERLVIRPLTVDDLAAIHEILDHDVKMDTLSLGERRQWLQWTVLNYQELARLYQPPFGERAAVLRDSGTLIGAVGLVPILLPFAQLAYYRARWNLPGDELTSMEIGLFWMLATGYQSKGYATEAARALIDYAFTTLRLRRIVATTEYTNERSIAVMRRLGMQIEKNLTPEVNPYLQIVGILENQIS